MLRFSSIGILLISLASSASAQRSEPASQAELDSISAWGRRLHAYHEAVSAAREALASVGPARRRLWTALATRVDGGWRVDFGRRDERHGAFEVLYTAHPTDPAGAYRIEAHDPAIADSGYLAAAARAHDVTRRDFVGIWNSYEVMVFPLEPGRLVVYHVPSPIEHDVWPLGADARYVVSYDGTIIDRRSLHRRVSEFPPDSLRARDIIPVQGMHTHSTLIDEAPTETDVFHVLVRRPRVDEIVVTRRWVYGIKVDGRARFLTTTELFFAKR